MGLLGEHLPNLGGTSEVNSLLAREAPNSNQWTRLLAPGSHNIFNVFFCDTSPPPPPFAFHAGCLWRFERVPGTLVLGAGAWGFWPLGCPQLAVTRAF